MGKESEDGCKDCRYCNLDRYYRGEWYCWSPQVSIFDLPVDPKKCFEGREQKKAVRKKLNKAQRQQVYGKCNGRCAYCGHGLEYRDMQVDHMTPLKIGGADEISNMLPACRSCNHYKSSLDVEGYRQYLAGIHKRLMRDSIPFQVATRFGIVRHMGDGVTFYFERCGKPESEGL